MIKPVVILLSSVVLAGGAPLQENDEARWLISGLAVSETYIVFSYAGDLWRVRRPGGVAERLTSGPAEDDFPVFAPHGLNVAFSRRGADDWDVYLIGLQGGEPRRLTYNPEADIARGWSPDGARVLFTSHRDEEGIFRLYTIGTSEAFPIPLPLPRAWDGSFSPEGDRIAYVPFALPLDLGSTDWRYYRGGMAAPIWVARLSDSRIEKLPRENSNDRDPMWVAGAIYFVSDRTGTFNLHSYGLATERVEQLTSYERYGVEAAAAGGGVIAFVQDGRIRLFDPATGETQTLTIEIEPDSSELRPRSVAGPRWLQSAAPSASGERVIFGVRGDVVSFDVASGAAENLTQTPGIAERYPAVSPDGQSIAYFSDESGEYQLHVRPADGQGSVRKIPVELRPSFYRELTWSPDSKRLAFSDKRLNLWVVDLETGGARRVATSSYSGQGRYYPAWSPDGAWLAYSMVEANRVGAVYLYHVERSRHVRVSDGRAHAEHPVFDRSGRYLYFLASNTAGLGEFGWSVLSGDLFRPLVSRRLHVALLDERTPPPVLPVTGAPNPEAESIPPGAAPGERPAAPPAGRQRPAGPARPGAARPGMQVPGLAGLSTQGTEGRTVPLPLPAKDYARLAAGEPGVLYVWVREWPFPQPGSSPTRTLYRYELSQPRELVKLVEDASEFSVTADGRTILYKRDDSWFLTPGDRAPEAGTGQLDLASIQIEVDPAAEWRQIYHEAWRLMRDYFYDPGYHGHNLGQLERHYATYLPTVTRRRDLNTLLGKALGHVSVSHLSVGGGDLPEPSGTGSRIGFLGADYEIHQGRYRITRIYGSGPYNSGNPLLQAPLDQPGVRVSEGEYLLAVDGEQIAATRNLYSYFEGKALTPIRITVGSEPEDGQTRTFTVVPLPGENTLRRWNWALRNRQLVEEQTEGVLGYIYVPSFGSTALELVFAQLLESVDRRGLIIDERFNGGGITADWLIEWLRRRPLYYYAFRHGDNLGVPTNALPAAKVLLINDADFSAAETLALMFKQGALGRILGTRTAGAGIGPYVFIPELIDGGRIGIPNRAAFDPTGSWAIENEGVAPDIEVEWLPEDWRAGRDPQLERAIEMVLRLVVDNPPAEVKRPEYPVHE
ncbi:MAG: PD40 domain-containing protein [Gemmatimonadota bacterium]|nr:MAG: PD40 domain-containing protein [Gemmatimonadota bacterium]